MGKAKKFTEDAVTADMAAKICVQLGLEKGYYTPQVLLDLLAAQGFGEVTLENVQAAIATAPDVFDISDETEIVALVPPVDEFSVATLIRWSWANIVAKLRGLFLHLDGGQTIQGHAVNPTLTLKTGASQLALRLDDVNGSPCYIFRGSADLHAFGVVVAPDQTEPVYIVYVGSTPVFTVNPDGSFDSQLGTMAGLLVNGNGTITGDLGVTGEATLGSLTVSGGVSIPDGSITISNVADLANQLSGKLPTTGGTINGNLTLTGTLTVGGQTELAASQAATTAQSAMSRELSLREQLFSLGVCRPLHMELTGRLNTSGSGFAGLSDNAGFQLQSGVTANSWQRGALCRNLTGNPGSSGAAANATAPFAIAVSAFQTIEAFPTSEITYIVGDAGTGAPPAIGSNKIAGRGFGSVVYWSTANSRREIKLFAHNGTTYVESPGVAFPITSLIVDQFTNVILSTNGAGTVKLFFSIGGTNLSGLRTSTTPAITLIGGPTSGTYAGPFFSILTQNAATPPVNQAQVRCLNAIIHNGVIY